MSLFLSKFVNKIDKKGRVSVPARFRAILQDKGFSAVVLFPTVNGDAIECCGMDVMEGLLTKIGPFDPFSEERESFADAIMNDAVELPIDGDGRIMISADMLEEAGISGQCTFVGRGDSFQIWNPQALEVRLKQSKERARQKRKSSSQNSDTEGS